MPSELRVRATPYRRVSATLTGPAPGMLRPHARGASAISSTWQRPTARHPGSSSPPNRRRPCQACAPGCRVVALREVVVMARPSPRSAARRGHRAWRAVPTGPEPLALEFQPRNFKRDGVQLELGRESSSRHDIKRVNLKPEGLVLEIFRPTLVGLDIQPELSSSIRLDFTCAGRSLPGVPHGEARPSLGQ